MPNIFISYRREDSLGHTGRLFDRLGKHFGKTHVFMDIAGIEPGLDFVEAIDKAVSSCDVFIVVIGKQWLNVTDADGRRRLDNPEDFIRLELGTALRRNIRVIPVLVQGATAPSSENLPEDLRMLSRRQAQEVSDNRWDFDAGELIKTIEKSLKKKYPVRFWWSKIPRWAIVVFVVTLFSAGVTIFSPSGPPIEPSIEMPNIVGERFEKAKAILADKGLSVLTSEKQTGEKPPGTVVGQKPEPGTKLKKGDRVDLVLAVKSVIKMPNVVGKRIEEAKAALREAGLAVPEVKDTKTNEKSPGIVLKQTPTPGIEVEPGERVALIIALKPDSPVMPLEQQRQEAKKLAEDYYASVLRKDVRALLGMASLPFFFDNEVLTRLEDIEKKWRDIFSQVASKGEDLSTSQLREIKAQTISELKKEGYDIQRDRFLKNMDHKDGDFKISILIEKGNRKHGQALYTRDVGGVIKLAGFWD